jgi:hypothetical protein
MERERFFTNGGRQEMLVRHADVIAAFIEKQRLTPIDAGFAVGRTAVAKAATRATLPKLPPVEARLGVIEELILRLKGFPGGMQLDHLHFDGGVYILTREQWTAFCGEMLGIYRDRLAAVSEVSFDQLSSLSAALDTMPQG